MAQRRSVAQVRARQARTRGARFRRGQAAARRGGGAPGADHA